MRSRWKKKKKRENIILKYKYEVILRIYMVRGVFSFVLLSKIPIDRWRKITWSGSWESNTSTSKSNTVLLDMYMKL